MLQTERHTEHTSRLASCYLLASNILNSIRGGAPWNRAGFCIALFQPHTLFWRRDLWRLRCSGPKLLPHFNSLLDM